ncbi:Protein transport protein Sec24C [Armadillidium vulgare]|nr:Protein transport protein Sec24C [Armadillidium vulgare]
MYQPPLPTQGMRPPGVPPPGSIPPAGLPPPQRPPPLGMPPPQRQPVGLPPPQKPVGLPPPQRPPAGYRPPFPGGNLPPPNTLSSGMGTPSSMKPPIDMISNMSSLSINSSNSQLSNGIADVSSPSLNPPQTFGGGQIQNSATVDPQNLHSTSAYHPTSNSMQRSYQGESFETSQNSNNSSLGEGRSSFSQDPSHGSDSISDINSGQQRPASNSNYPGYPLDSHQQSNTIYDHSVFVSSALPQPSAPNNVSDSFHGISGSNVHSPNSFESSKTSGIDTPKSLVQPSPFQHGIPPSVTQMEQLRPGISPSIGVQRPGMPPISSPSGFSSHNVSPLNTQMVPPRPGMPPSNSHMGPPRFGMPPVSSPIGPPRPGVPPLGPMGPPKQGMPPFDPQTGSPRLGMPPISSSTTSFQPPPAPVSSFPGHGTINQHQSMAQIGPGVPPTPASMGQIPPQGMGGMQGRYPGASTAASPMSGYNQGNQGRRLNPDDMPSPLQVMEEDRHFKSGEFITNLKGGVPPLVTTDFVVKDAGNASPRFIRSTMYNVPATQDMMKQSSVPFGLVISPLADLHPEEAPIYTGTSLTNGPVRCNRCKGYMSPLMMFMDGGRRFQCLLCKQINEVPADYFAIWDSQGARADKFQRPELCLGSYEFAATVEYCKDKLLPKEPAFIFILEMSQLMVQRGIINLLCQNMKSLLKHLPKEQIPGQEVTKSSIKVGFITYDSSVHFYKLTGLAPEMCVVCDKENMFVPVPDGVLCDVEEVSDNIDKLMECIPQNFTNTKEISGTLSCAIQAGMSALMACGRPGKLFVFHSSLPQTEGSGKLKNREDRKLLGTDKEKTVLTPQTTHYNNLAQELVGVGCGVDFFIFNENYVDLATIGQVARLTGGQCYKYTYFQPNRDSERLFEDLRLNISRNIAFDSVMRVRTSTGVRPVEFFGHIFMSNTHDIELAVIDSNKAIAVEIKHDDKITEEDGVYIQVALLYTSVGGQRRLRILNLALNICTQLADLYKNCELDTLMNFFGKQAMFKFLESSAKQIKENLVARAAQILACYRKNCASPSSVGQLILPELMKLLPLYVNCLAKCDALSGGQDLTCDDKSWHIYQLTTMPVEASVVYYYPRLIPLTDLDPKEEISLPPAVRTSYEKLNQDGIYLLENGLFMFLWVGSGTSPALMKDVFGVAAPHQLDPVLSELPELENPMSKCVRAIIALVRQQRNQHVRLFVVPQQGKHEMVMRNYLVEDKGVYGAPSYVDFLCHVHKEIRAILS